MKATIRKWQVIIDLVKFPIPNPWNMSGKITLQELFHNTSSHQTIAGIQAINIRIASLSRQRHKNPAHNYANCIRSCKNEPDKWDKK